MELIISTSLSKTSFALADYDTDFCVLSESDKITESNTYDILRKLTVQAGKDLNKVKTIYLDIGPGGTSSVRVGVAIANAVAYVSGATIFPIVSSKIILRHEIIINQVKNTDVICLHRSIKGNAFLSQFDEKGQLNVYYGSLKNLVSDLITGRALTILADRKTCIDISKYAGCKNHEVECNWTKFGVNFQFFTANRHVLASTKLQFPELAIPFTENDAKLYE